MKLPKTLLAPDRPGHLSDKIKWLAGEGAGSWFELNQIKGSQLEVVRYSPAGNIECQVVFEFPLGFDIAKDYSLDYPCHCAVVTLVQGASRFEANRLI